MGHDPSARHGTAKPAGSAPEHRLNRSFSLRSAFSLAFADVSPIVALYAIFALGLFAAGPAFWWAFPVVLVGQLLVALVFGELSSKWPFAGSVYQWARHVQGTTWGWAAMWAYIWGLTIALATLSYGASGFLLQACGVTDASRNTTIGVALLILVAGSITNMVGRSVLKVMVVASIICEIVASVGLSLVLLIFHRENSLSVLFDGFGTAGAGTWLTGPALAAMAYVGWSFVGFEAAGSIAEEVDKPERNVPRAIIWSLVCVAAIVMFSSASLILAIPDLDTMMADQPGDPVTLTLTSQLGNAVGKPLLVMFVIGFLSSFLAVQAAVSRCIWGSARDHALPAPTFLGKLAGRERLPVNAIAVTGVVAALLLLMSGSDFYGILVNFTSMGFQIAFGIPVLGVALARLRGRWQPGVFSLGRWGAPVTYAAAVWCVLQTVNIAWPRSSAGDTWYMRWSMVLTSAMLAVVGILIHTFVRGRIKGPLAGRLADIPEGPTTDSPAAGTAEPGPAGTARPTSGSTTRNDLENV